MDRRIALKNLGMALGYTVAAPTLISIVQSCQAEKIIDWTPDFFSKEEGSVLTHLVDIILPKTDTPSATDVQVNIFIDQFVNEVIETEQQEFLKMIMGKFVEKALKDSGKETPAELEAEELEAVLTEALKADKEQQKAHQEAIEAYMMAMAEGQAAELSDETARYSFASNLREMTIWGYKTTEYVAENVLAYLPVPGEYVPCGSVDELTGGNAWSI